MSAVRNGSFFIAFAVAMAAIVVVVQSTRLPNAAAVVKSEKDGVSIQQNESSDIRPYTLPDADRAVTEVTSASFQLERKRQQRAVQFHKLWACINEHAEAENISEIISFLKTRDCPDGVTWDALRNLKDHVMIRLDVMDPQPPEYARTLRSIAGDVEQDMALRQYAVQHMASAYGGVTSEEKELLRNTLTTLMHQYSTPLSGTAMLSLIRIQKEYGEDNSAGVRRAVLECIRQPVTHPATKATAVALCGDASFPESLPDLRILATTENDVLIRIAAVHALISAGSETDREMLKSLIPEANEDVVNAIESGLKLRQRKIESSEQS